MTSEQTWVWGLEQNKALNVMLTWLAVKALVGRFALALIKWMFVQVDDTVAVATTDVLANISRWTLKKPHTQPRLIIITEIFQSNRDIWSIRTEINKKLVHTAKINEILKYFYCFTKLTYHLLTSQAGDSYLSGTSCRCKALYISMWTL